MRLKDIIDSPCGLRFLFDDLELQSGFSRRLLLETSMMQDADAIEKSYAVLSDFHSMILQQKDTPYINTLQFRLQGLKDIRTTLKHLSSSMVLDDIEFFEVKHLALLTTQITDLFTQLKFHPSIEIPDMSRVIELLDPDGLRMASFYIYDSYSEKLKGLRVQMKNNPDRVEELLVESNVIEDQIRKELSKELQKHLAAIEKAQSSLADVDVYLAKALQIMRLNLAFPSASKDEKTSLQGMFNPQVKAALKKTEKEYQPVDIEYGYRPTIITGANMGGKTVVLKTLTLCQYLFQFGFGIPAVTAIMDVKDEIYFCIGDDQSLEKGLSSFAAEMKNIDAVIVAAKQNRKILALIDEPARTTNPIEGTALVSALVKILQDRHISLLITTHYNIESYESSLLRVKGLVNGKMDYALVKAQKGVVPHEALNIAENLGVDAEWIANAKMILKEK